MTVSQCHHGHMTVSKDSSEGQKVFFRAEGSGAHSYHHPYVPIVLCAVLAYTNLELVRKWRTPQVAKQNRVID